MMMSMQKFWAESQSKTPKRKAKTAVLFGASFEKEKRSLLRITNNLKLCSTV